MLYVFVKVFYDIEWFHKGFIARDHVKSSQMNNETPLQL